MGIYIKGMTMPKACVYRENGHLMTCPLYDIDGYCKALNTEARHKENEKLSCCPLVPIQPHGRLIDADALTTVTEMVNGEWKTYVEVFEVADAPTIIESEGEDG